MLGRVMSSISCFFPTLEFFCSLGKKKIKIVNIKRKFEQQVSPYTKENTTSSMKLLQIDGSRRILFHHIAYSRVKPPLTALVHTCGTNCA